MTSAPLSSRTAIILLLVLGTLWGFNTSMAKLAGQEGVPPIGLTTIQMTGAAALLMLFCLWRGISVRFERAYLKYYIHMGIIGTALPSVNLVNALRELPAGVMVLAIATVPMMTYGLSLLLKMEKFDLWRFFGVLVGLGGVLLIIIPSASLPETEDAGWFLIGLLTPVLYAYSAIAAARFRPEGSHSLGLSAGMVFTVAVTIWPVALLTGQDYIPEFFPPNFATLAISAVTAIACVAFFLYFELVRSIGPVSISVVGYVVTLTGIIFGMIFFDERHSTWVWAAAALIFSGLALVNGRQAAGAIMKSVKK